MWSAFRLYRNILERSTPHDSFKDDKEPFIVLKRKRIYMKSEISYKYVLSKKTGQKFYLDSNQTL